MQPVGRPCGTWMYYAVRDVKDVGQQMAYLSQNWNIRPMSWEIWDLFLNAYYYYYYPVSLLLLIMYCYYFITEVLKYIISYQSIAEMTLWSKQTFTSWGYGNK